MSFLVNPYSYATGCDADAVAFLAAAGITDATITSAICTLVTTMKADGTWAKMNAIYPFVGNTASQHKWNLKDPRDLNAAFRLTFSGGWTHSANGALPNGTNSYADTFFNPSANASLNSHHLSYYSRTNVAGAIQVEIGFATSSSSSLINTRNSTTSRFRINSASVDISGADTDSRAYYIANRTASNVLNGWRNSTKIANGTTASSSLANANIWLAAFNNLPFPAFRYYSTKQCAFATIGSGLTDGEAAALYTAVQAMQITLSRQV